jgi:hypothetical protein
MRARHGWFAFAALGAGGIYLTKALLVISTRDGLPTVAGGLYLAGLLLGLATAIGAGLRQRSRPTRLAVGAGAVFLLIMWIVSLSDVLGTAVASLTDSQVIQDELPIAIAGVALIAVGARALRRDRETARSTPDALT